MADGDATRTSSGTSAELRAALVKRPGDGDDVPVRTGPAVTHGLAHREPGLPDGLGPRLEPDRDLMCGRVLGEFVVRERIGGGGFGVVYRCEQPLLGREAVIKVIHGSLRDSDVARERFLREAHLASRVDHPYAAHIYAFGIEPEDGLCWIAMELVAGTTLADWLHDRGPLALDQLVPFLDRLAEVVQTAHERGIVHRDLKPSNIMVIERAGRLLPKLLDLGIAKVFDPTAPLPSASGEIAVPGEHALSSNEARALATTEPPRSGSAGSQPLTQRAAMLGSPPYMAPEQWFDATAVGPPADLYALGVIAFEALSGRRPYGGPGAAQAALDLDVKPPPLGAGFSPALDRFFERALAKRAHERPATALELAAMLRIAAGFGGTTEDLPRLDEALRDAWLAEAPHDLAECVAALDGARNLHQARDAARELCRELVRYLLALALAARAQVRGERDAPELLELLRAVRRRDLDDRERVELVRLLVQPFVGRRGAYPIPELVDAIGPGPGGAASDPFDQVLGLGLAADLPSSEELVRSQLAVFLPALARLMRATGPVLDYTLVVPRAQAAERWMGLGRQRRAIATVRSGALVDDQPVLLDRNAQVVLHVAPLIQAVAATHDTERELFVFDGRGARAARLVASPAGFVRHDPAVWDWFADHVLGETDGEAAPSADDRPPYLGLASFSAGDADRFVGREREIEACVNRLRSLPLLVVFGASGAGKSSFVHAGVLPALPAGWRSVALRPGGTPLQTLTARLAAVAGAGTAAAAGNATTVIVVDQLEELFTLCHDPAEREQFAARLAEASASPDLPTRVVLVVRDDFLMQVESLEPLRAALSPALFLLGNPSRHELMRMVVDPARRRGYELSDDQLARDMVDMVADRPGALALLSFTASRLWELRDRRFRQLTRNAYGAMGGVAGALGQHAEDTFRSLLGDEQRLAREAFRHLVTADQTRAVVPTAELYQRLAAPRAAQAIEKLVAARLLAAVEDDTGPHIEIVHEALIAAWPRLAQWTREDHQDAGTREQVHAAAKQWDDRGRPRELVWRGNVLAELERWRSRATLTALEAAFADASRREANRARRIRRGLVAAAFVVLGIVAAGATVASIQISRAEQRASDNAARAEGEAARATDALASIQREESQRRAAEAQRVAAEAQRLAAETSAANARRQVAAQGAVIQDDRNQLAAKNKKLEAAVREATRAKQLADLARADAEAAADQLATANAKLQQHIDALAREKQKLTTTLK